MFLIRSLRPKPAQYDAVCSVVSACGGEYILAYALVSSLPQKPLVSLTGVQTYHGTMFMGCDCWFSHPMRFPSQGSFSAVVKASARIFWPLDELDLSVRQKKVSSVDIV